MSAIDLRRALLARPIMAAVGGGMPELSATENESIVAGDTWLDADLFSGDPDWSKLLAVPRATLSGEE
ncbi:hypothetical protein [Sphingomonas sp.]|uniref:hypothetical protein n=1 Tax=Sphingomonas sp. TaxID=28214 RepID=UPI003AFFFB07